ncbi:hypothetical protein EVAR_38630_1 [Eumeta japonica]|uniref:Uncharacterized protein n=1 Tax=Eumeta variegata TaxID=151549 RepID=A0A4C1Y0A3_EUMVA|nr:hypothetical protein EVAR_38630_1 [Eumeta japonica]
MRSLFHGPCALAAPSSSAEKPMTTELVRRMPKLTLTIVYRQFKVNHYMLIHLNTWNIPETSGGARRAPCAATRKPIIGGKSNIAEILRKRNVSGIGDVRALFRLGRAAARAAAADLIDATPSRDRADRDARAVDETNTTTSTEHSS